MMNAGLTREEAGVAHLLLDGMTQRGIARKLSMSSSKVKQCEDNIRQKLNLMGDPDPKIAGIASGFNLTKREIQILKYLRDDIANEQIAAELYISEETVRFHIRNLLKKLGVKTRQDFGEWFDRYKTW